MNELKLAENKDFFISNYQKKKTMVSSSIKTGKIVCAVPKTELLVPNFKLIKHYRQYKFPRKSF